MNLVLNLGIRTLLIMGLSLSHPFPESPPEETTILNFVLNSPFFLIVIPIKKNNFNDKCIHPYSICL